MALSEKELEVQKEYLDTLNTLNCNSKPLIDVLTDVAEENREFACVIFRCIEDQLERVSNDLKLPILYLIDSIIKNEKVPVYKQMFCYRLHLLFVKVYKEGKDDVRNRLSKLRATWNGVLPPVVLSAIDNEVRKINPTWPSSTAVHVNPKFIPQGTTAAPFVIHSMKTESASKTNVPDSTRIEISMKRKELLELKKKSEQLERKNIQKPLDNKNDRLSDVANQVISDVEKLKTGVHNPAEVQKVRDTAIALKNSLLKSLDQNSSKDLLQNKHTTFSDLIKKLDETIKVLSEMENNPSKRKVIVDKNNSSTVNTTPAASTPNPISTKSAIQTKAWLGRNASNNPYVYTKPASNGTSVTPANPPTFRIAPVSSQLINAAAARRPRDPRLRKIEEQDVKTPANTVVVSNEVKVPPASIPTDIKNDKTNALVTDATKTKEFVSETPATGNNTVAAHAAKSSQKSVRQVDREPDRRPEKNAAQAKVSMFSQVESAKRETSPAPKFSSTTSSNERSPTKYDPSQGDIIIPAAPSITSSKKLLPARKKDSSSKSETKPTKIRVKVVKNVIKGRASKRSTDESSEVEKPSTSKMAQREETSASMTREERQKKLDTFADALIKADENKRHQLMENLSKSHPKMAQKLVKRIKKKMSAAAVAAEVTTPTPPPAPRLASPIVVEELMDVTDDTNDLILVSGPKASEVGEEAVIDQPAAAESVSDTLMEQEYSPENVPMDIYEDSEKETQFPLEEEKRLLDVEETFDESVNNSSTSMNLSEQLEAVMNSAKKDQVSVPVAQDVDIRSLLTNNIGMNLNCPLPVVAEIIAPPLPLATDSTAAPAFPNPFGLSQAPTKDIDYRQLFHFPLPAAAIATGVELPLVEQEPIVGPEMKASSPARVSEAEGATAAVVTGGDVLATEKQPVKRKQGDEPVDEVKRRRTTSGGSSDGGGSDGSEMRPATPPAAASSVVAAAAKSGSPERLEPSPQQQLMTLRSSLENIFNVPSDSDEEANAKETLDGDEKAGGGGDGGRVRREQSSYSLAAVQNEDEHSMDALSMPPAEPRPPSKSPPPTFPMLTPNPTFTTPNFGMFMSATPEIPEANPDVLKMIRRDPVRSIHIDGISREIRHYGSTAVTFLNWDDPRQISFFDGARKIVIDKDIEIQCYLNGPDVEYKVYGQYHRFRLGAPTRELYIDGIGYECYFDGTSKRIRIGGKWRCVRLHGGPPRVHIGRRKRQDLVAGKIDIIINEELTLPIYLDAKPQAINVHGIPFVIMFIDSLKRVLINDVPFRTAFGGLSQSFKFKNKVYYFRFDILPAGIIPGAVSIFQMIMTKLPSPPPLPPSLQYCDDFPLMPGPPSVPIIPNKPISKMETEPIINRDHKPNELKPPALAGLLENVNVTELFQKLVASGIVPGISNESDSKSKIDSIKSVDSDAIKFVDFGKPETFKQRQPGLVSKLYSGIQCGSCGLRFPREQTVKYSQHLDWHFRLNRRGKDGARMIHSRKWYYNSANWMQFQEMEDNSDRGTSWFESQAAAAVEYTEAEPEDIPSVSAGDNAHDAFCILCQDKFEQFYNDDNEEWHLRNAVRVDETLYHPTCYKDHMEKENSRSDVEEIVDLDDPIPVDDLTPTEECTINLDDTVTVEHVSENTNLDEIVTIGDDSIVIKQEKVDTSKSTACPIGETVVLTEAMNVSSSEDAAHVPIVSEKATASDEDEDSDIEEVQLIEQPIEEIIINDDVNDGETNLETLFNAEDTSVQQEADPLPAEAEEVEFVDTVDKVVDITHQSSVASMDGNIELGDSLQVINTGTKIKINIAKAVVATQNEERVPSSKSPSNELEPVSESEGEESPKEMSPKELNGFLSQPLPPGEEPITIEKKPRLKDRKLTEYPPVTKGTELSGLCSIM